MRKLFILFKDGYSVNVTIKSQPSDIGGEGYIYRINFPRHGVCILKIYKNAEKALKNRDKILTLVYEDMPQSKNCNIRFCWPIAIAYDENRRDFAGFVMPEAFPDSRDLYILEYHTINSTIREEFPDDVGWHDKYELNTLRGLRNRLAILHNWAAALSLLHKSGSFVLGDIKPTNVMVEPEYGRVSVIDIDSCQIMKNGRIKFARTAQTPSFRPPEITARIANNPIDENYDSFSFAVSAYEILSGTHPYCNCRLLPPYNTEEYASIVSCIKNGLSPYGNNSSYTERVLNCDLHGNIDNLPEPLVILFKQAFGGINRPDFKTWKSCLKQTILDVDKKM